MSQSAYTIFALSNILVPNYNSTYYWFLFYVTVIIEGESYDHHSLRFTEFNLVVESQGSGFDPGKFELRDMAQTKFSENCRNMIKQTTKSYKERVTVQWTAPPSGSGCVTFR